MNWRNVVKKLQSLGPGFDVYPSGVTEPQQNTCGIHNYFHNALLHLLVSLLIISVTVFLLWFASYFTI